MSDAAEQLAKHIDDLDSQATMLQMGVSLPDSIHVEALRTLLPELVLKLKGAYVEALGRNPWSW